jgi:hypothetical protein
MEIFIREKIKNTQELIPQIIDRIFAICKNDSNFELNNDFKNIDEKINLLKNKINKQDKLLNKSINFKKDILKRIAILDNQNEKKQIELLEYMN